MRSPRCWRPMCWSIPSRMKCWLDLERLKLLELRSRIDHGHLPTHVLGASVLASLREDGLIALEMSKSSWRSFVEQSPALSKLHGCYGRSA